MSSNEPHAKSPWPVRVAARLGLGVGGTFVTVTVLVACLLPFLALAFALPKIRRMGPLKEILGMLPGGANLKAAGADEGQLTRGSRPRVPLEPS